MPYSASALGVLPPLWSRAAKKPRPVLILSSWEVITFLFCTSEPGCRRNGRLARRDRFVESFGVLAPGPGTGGGDRPAGRADRNDHPS